MTTERIIVIARQQPRVPVTSHNVPTGFHWWTEHMGRVYLRGLSGTRVPDGWALVQPTIIGADPSTGIIVHEPPLPHLKWAWEAPVQLPRIDAQAAAEVVPQPADYVVVVREIPEGGAFTAAVGIGRKNGQSNLRGSFDLQREAVDAARIEARRRYAQDAEYIKNVIRHGRLDWGIPFELTLKDPTVVLPKQGQSSWEAYREVVDSQQL